MKPIARLRWIVLAGIMLAVVVTPFPAASPPTERTFHLDARRFEYNPSMITVNRGDRVTIELTAMDVVHGLAIDGYNVELTADPGQTARVTFIADRQGSFHFRCAVTCGNMHPFMLGRLVVGHNSLLWKALALMGLALFAAVWSQR